MVAQSIIDLIRTYLIAVNDTGIRTNQAVLFGSWAKGKAHEDSDIDLVVITPDFDGAWDRNLVDKLWELTGLVPDAWRIEPIACGEREWLENDERLILEIARQEGQVITLHPETA
jgi:predicted nucleotidyltransferase